LIRKVLDGFGWSLDGLWIFSLDWHILIILTSSIKQIDKLLFQGWNPLKATAFGVGPVGAGVPEPCR
jgi:hypothetical protein